MSLFIKKTFLTEEGIYSFDISNKDTLVTKMFYEADPFPNYNDDDNSNSNELYINKIIQDIKYNLTI